MIHQLRRKFILIAMVSVTLVMALMVVTINVINFISVDADLRETLDLIQGNQGAMPHPPDGKHDLRPGGRFDPETPFSTRYFVLRYDGEELVGVDLRHIAAVTQEDVGRYLAIALDRGEGYGYAEGGYKFRVAALDGERNMAVFLDCRQELRSLRLFALASLLAAAVCDALVYLLVLALSRRAIDPMVRNAERQKQFITDASHELKTPLTVIATSLKVLEMEVGECKWIDKIRAQTDKLGALVNDLVTLSRMDEERPPLQAAEFDVSAAVAECAESFLDHAKETGHPLELDIAPGLKLKGDEHAVRQLVSILLDNGFKYADGGAPVRLRLTGAKRGVVLETENPCAGVDPGELDKLFDRFYRADKARSSGGGFGIGLSIAGRIAEAHRGSIRAACPQPGVIRFTAALRDRT